MSCTEVEHNKLNKLNSRPIGHSNTQTHDGCNRTQWQSDTARNEHIGIHTDSLQIKGAWGGKKHVGSCRNLFRK